jgi:hypothetical protein
MRRQAHGKKPDPIGLFCFTPPPAERPELDQSGAHVNGYLSTLPSRAVPVERLHQAAQGAQP